MSLCTRRHKTSTDRFITQKKAERCPWCVMYSRFLGVHIVSTVNFFVGNLYPNGFQMTFIQLGAMGFPSNELNSRVAFVRIKPTLQQSVTRKTIGTYPGIHQRCLVATCLFGNVFLNEKEAATLEKPYYLHNYIHVMIYCVYTIYL